MRAPLSSCAYLNSTQRNIDITAPQLGIKPHYQMTITKACVQKKKHSTSIAFVNTAALRLCGASLRISWQVTSDKMTAETTRALALSFL